MLSFGRPPHSSSGALVTLLALVVSGACGGSESPSPQSPAPVTTPRPAGLAEGATLTLVSGEDAQPVGGATVSLGERDYQTDDGGQIRIAELAPPGTLLEITAAGFLDRRTIVRRDGPTRLVLWPSQTSYGMDEEFTAQIVYTYGARNPPPQGSSPLQRLRRGTSQVFVHLSDTLRNDERAHHLHELAVDDMNGSLNGQVVYTLTPTRPSSGIVFEAIVDPNTDICRDNQSAAYFDGTHQAGEITGGTIVYCDIEAARTDTATHEIGHTVGLQHSFGSNDIMGGSRYWRRKSLFSPRERLAMNLLFERRAGNRFPDRDDHVSGAAEASFRIVCD